MGAHRQGQGGLARPPENVSARFASVTTFRFVAIRHVSRARSVYISLNAYETGALPDPAGEITAPPDRLVGFKGGTFATRVQRGVTLPGHFHRGQFPPFFFPLSPLLPVINLLHILRTTAFACKWKVIKSYIPLLRPSLKRFRQRSHRVYTCLHTLFERSCFL